MTSYLLYSNPDYSLKCFTIKSKVLKTLSNLLIILPLFLLAACSKVSDCSINQELKLQVERTRALKFDQKLDCRLLNQDQIRDELISVVTESNSPESLSGEEEVYKYTGVIPEDFSYLESLISGYQSSVVGFYHYQDKYFGLAEGTNAKEERYTLIHELTHALQDQNFDVSQMMPNGAQSDLLLARRALLEADAKRVVEVYRRKFDCNRHNERTALIEARHRIYVASLDHFPRPLRMLIDFPYTHGLPFICEAMRIGKIDSVDDLFKRPPSGTREIIHPELYVLNQPLSGISSKGIEKGFKYSSSLGEYTIFSMLAGYLDMQTSHQAASGLEIDKFWLFDERLEWRSRWGDELEAKQFVEALISQFVSRYPDTIQQNLGKSRIVKSKSIAMKVSRQARAVVVIYRKR